MTIATQQYFPLILFVMLNKQALTFETVIKILSVSIQMKAIEQQFPVVMFIKLLELDWTFKSGMTTATQQYFPEVLFIMPNKVVLMFETVDKLKQVSMTNYSGLPKRV